MSIVVRFTPASLTAEQYDESVRRLTEAGDFPPEGLDYHVGIEPGEPEITEVHNIVRP